MMRARYRQFRSYGHGPVVAAMLTPTTVQVLAAACAAGLFLGVML